MSEQADRQEIAPYLNPNYWEGHSLGVGHWQEVNPNRGFPDSREIRFARQVINTCLEGGSIFPLDTLSNGSTFDPTEHQPGTVVLFRKESLRGLPVTADYSLDELSEHAVPLRPTGLSPSFGDDAPIVVAGDGKRGYLSHVRWGVVPEQSDENHVISVPASSVLRGRLGTHVRKPAPFFNTLAPITISETTHRSSSSVPTERLARVNILQIITYGTPERHGSRASRFLPHLRTQGL